MEAIEVGTDEGTEGVEEGADGKVEARCAPEALM